LHNVLHNLEQQTIIQFLHAIVNSSPCFKIYVVDVLHWCYVKEIGNGYC